MSQLDGCIVNFEIIGLSSMERERCKVTSQLIEGGPMKLVSKMNHWSGSFVAVRSREYRTHSYGLSQLPHCPSKCDGCNASRAATGVCAGGARSVDMVHFQAAKSRHDDCCALLAASQWHQKRSTPKTDSRPKPWIREEARSRRSYFNLNHPGTKPNLS